MDCRAAQPRDTVSPSPGRWGNHIGGGPCTDPVRDIWAGPLFQSLGLSLYIGWGPLAPHTDVDESACQEVVVAWSVDDCRRLSRAEGPTLHLRTGKSGLAELVELGKSVPAWMMSISASLRRL